MRFHNYSRPVDRSLPAFKFWMLSMMYPLRPSAEKLVTTQLWIDEQGWMANWTVYWATVDGNSKRHDSDNEA